MLRRGIGFAGSDRGASCCEQAMPRTLAAAAGATHALDELGYEFDLDNDGIREDGDDILITGASGNPNVPHIGADSTGSTGDPGSIEVRLQLPQKASVRV